MTRSSKGKKSREGERRLAADRAQRFPQPTPPVEPATEPTEDPVVTP